MTKFALSYTIAVGLILIAHQAVGQYDLDDTNLDYNVQMDPNAGKCYMADYYANLPNCWLGFEQIGQKFYWISPQLFPKFNWHGAWLQCRRKNGYLASFSDMNELFEVANTIYWNGYSVSDYFWTDGNDLAEEGVYRWFENGELVDTTLFTPGEPNKPGVERCLHIWTAYGQHYYGLNNIECDKELYCVCVAREANVC